MRAANGAWENKEMDIITTVLGIIVGLIALTFLVVIHELGHAIVARRNGVVVEEFGIGFPPRAWSRKLRNGIEFSLNWLPLGGFVKMQGESDDSRKQGDYGSVSFWAKTKILLAGVLINYIAAFLIFTLLYWIGMPKVLPDQASLESHAGGSGAGIAAIQDGSPAQKAGLKTGDRITQVDNTHVGQGSDLITYTKAHAGKTVSIKYERAGHPEATSATLRPASDASEGLLGVSTVGIETLHATWSAPIAALLFSGQLIAATFQGFGTLFADLGQAHFAAAGSQVAGPVGIFGTIFPTALKDGPLWVLLVTGLISLSLAIMNTLPIPALDGGRWFVTALFRVLRRPLGKELEERIHGTGFMILLLLIGLITVLDIGRLIK